MIYKKQKSIQDLEIIIFETFIKSSPSFTITKYKVSL